jgi:hypothetical protein
MTETIDAAPAAPAAPAAQIENPHARKLTALADVFGEEFADNFRDPVLCTEQTLWAPMPQGMYRRDFRLLSRSLYLESVYRRRTGYNQDVLDNFARMIGEKLVAITKLFETRNAQLTKLYKDNGQKAESVYLKPQHLYVPIIAPGARSFMQLLERLDNYYQLTGCATLLGLLDGGQRRGAELELRKAVRSFIGMVRTEQAKLRRESVRLQNERSGHAVDADVEQQVIHAEQLVDEAEKHMQESTEDLASHVAPEDAQGVLDAIVANGTAAGTAATRGRAKTTAQAPAPAPAPEAVPVPT